MASFSKVILMGNLTRDPELRSIPSGTQVCNFDLAMNRVYTTQAGERKEEVCYMTIVVWGKQGENCAQYLKKGRQALVEGHLQQRSWTTPEGQKRSKLEVVAERVQFLGDGQGSRVTTAPDPDADPPAYVPEADPPAPLDDGVPF
ncbi:MAG TPA: single-stranded DNA-binding protein [Candidatus Methylomirabilis sp.]|jgi:single-strand DNA-binding protein